ncbi:hypothetical protein ABK040_010321 [Willaertia magna]
MAERISRPVDPGDDDDGKGASRLQMMNNNNNITSNLINSTLPNSNSHVIGQPNYSINPSNTFSNNTPMLNSNVSATSLSMYPFPTQNRIGNDNTNILTATNILINNKTNNNSNTIPRNYNTRQEQTIPNTFTFQTNDPQLKIIRACKKCRQHHKRCTGGRPCERCKRKGYKCESVTKVVNTKVKKKKESSSIPGSMTTVFRLDNNNSNLHTETPPSMINNNNTITRTSNTTNVEDEEDLGYNSNESSASSANSPLRNISTATSSSNMNQHDLASTTLNIPINAANLISHHSLQSSVVPTTSSSSQFNPELFSPHIIVPSTLGVNNNNNATNATHEIYNQMHLAMQSSFDTLQQERDWKQNETKKRKNMKRGNKLSDLLN